MDPQTQTPSKGATSPRSEHLMGRTKADKSDWRDQLQQMRMGLDLMQKEADAILAKSGLTAEVMDAALANPSNFSSEDWQLIDSARQRASTFKEELKQVLSGVPSNPSAPPRPPRKPRAKIKKNWIPLQ